MGDFLVRRSPAMTESHHAQRSNARENLVQDRTLELLAPASSASTCSKSSHFVTATARMRLSYSAFPSGGLRIKLRGYERAGVQVPPVHNSSDEGYFFGFRAWALCLSTGDARERPMRSAAFVPRVSRKQVERGYSSQRVRPSGAKPGPSASLRFCLSRRLAGVGSAGSATAICCS
jgi:hypothetical protein